MFLQLHTLTSYHAALLNRDDAGLAKRIPFGNAPRLRVSSQCLKRHWRDALQKEVDLPGAIRSRQFFSREILPGLCKEGVEESLAKLLVQELIGKIIDGGTDGDSLALKQPVLFGRPEANFLIDILSECAKADDPEKALGEKLKTDKKNFKAMLRQAGHGDMFAGLEGALFGRFVTSAILSRSDAPVHVAHSFTVHGLDTDVDFFTVVDDLNRADESGAAHAGDMELGAGVFYGYMVVDIPLLVSNFTGCDSKEWRTQDTADARRVLAVLIRAIATVSPGAKLGATAPYAYSDLVVLEAGRQQPRSLANAYLEAIRPSGNTMQKAVDALYSQLRDIENMYGATADRRAVSTTHQWVGEPKAQPLDGAISSIIRAIFEE